MHKIQVGIFAVLIAVPATSFAGYRLGPKPKVSFFATGSPGFLSIEGKTTDITLVDDGEQLAFTVPIASVDTGIALRDQHMRDKYVQADQFPDLVLVLPRSAVAFPAEKGRMSEGTVEATFTTHGVALPVTVTYTAKRKTESWTVSASFPFDVSKHGIEIPSYMGVTIDPAMQAEVVLDVVEQP